MCSIGVISSAFLGFVFHSMCFGTQLERSITVDLINIIPEYQFSFICFSLIAPTIMTAIREKHDYILFEFYFDNGLSDH